MKEEIESDPVIATLKKRYFEVLRQEDYPNTPELTKEADNIEAAIKTLSERKYD